jgi:hypothetical protein
MTAVLPAHLQGRFLSGSWNESRRGHFLSFETDSGFDLRSKIPGSGRTDCSGTVQMTAEEFSDLEAFYASDCSEGSVGFYMEHPRLHTTQTFMWAAPPQLSHVAVDIYNVAFALIMD